MISLRFKLGSLIFALVAAYFLVNHANAQQPIYSGQSITAVTFTLPAEYINETNIYCLFQDQQSKGCSNTSDFDGANPQTQNLVTDWFFENNEALQVDFVILQAGGYIDCQATLLDCLNSAFYIDDNGIILPTELPPEPGSNQTWGESGVFGDTTPEDIKENLTASVQDSGANIWPLIAFAGVAFAFIIALEIVVLMNKSVPAEKNSKKSKSFDPVAFNKKADELQEFYSKTGGADPVLVEQIKKRGRGRPRKTDIGV